MKLPLVPTLMVVVALPILITLGFWQLGRAAEKDSMLDALENAPNLAPLILSGEEMASYPADSLDFRRVSTRCQQISAAEALGGRSKQGQAGYSYFADCAPTMAEDRFRINLGWDQRPDRRIDINAPAAVSGMVRADRGDMEQTHRIPYLLIADPALGGLLPSLQPTPADIPDNHMAYAFQWFGFAAVLAVIYGLYVRSWRRDSTS
ncbi:MAG: SURF1 family protein [Pacificimonas sp.]